MYQQAEQQLPDDAIYMVRVTNFANFKSLIQSAAKQAGKSETEVLKSALTNNREQLNAAFPFTSEALNYLAERLGISNQ